MIKFTITGQVRSGKNNMLITRSGRHYPNPSWALWRDQVVRQLRDQWGDITVAYPCEMVGLYWAGDLRRRDVPGMIDAIFHCLEKGNFVKDDGLIRTVNWFYCGHDKNNPRVELEISEQI